MWFTQHDIWIHTYMSQLETNNLQQTKKWFTLVTYVVHSAWHLNTYIHTLLSWKQAIYKKPTSGLLCSPMSFTQHDIWIHTYMSQLKTSNLQKTNKWLTLFTYVVHSTWHLNTYLHVSVGNKQLTTNKKVVYSVHLCGLLTTFKYVHPCFSWKQAIYKNPISGLLYSPMSFT